MENVDWLRVNPCFSCISLRRSALGWWPWLHWEEARQGLLLVLPVSTFCPDFTLCSASLRPPSALNHSPPCLSKPNSEKDFMKTLYCCCLGVESCPTLGDPMDWSPPGPSVHGILQARILEWVAMPSSRGSSNPGIEQQQPSVLLLSEASVH